MPVTRRLLRPDVLAVPAAVLVVASSALWALDGTTQTTGARPANAAALLQHGVVARRPWRPGTWTTRRTPWAPWPWPAGSPWGLSGRPDRSIRACARLMWAPRARRALRSL